MDLSTNLFVEYLWVELYRFLLERYACLKSMDLETSFLLDLLICFWYFIWSLKNFSVLLMSRVGEICWFCILASKFTFLMSISFIWRFLREWFKDLSFPDTAICVRLGSNALWNVFRAELDLSFCPHRWLIPTDSLLPLAISANLPTSLRCSLSSSW